MSATYSLGTHRESAIVVSSSRSLSWIERIVLGVGIWEIPLQLDKYMMFHERDSSLGAVAGINISLTTISLVVLYTIWFFRRAVQRSGIQGPMIAGFPMLIYISFVTLSALSAELPLLSLFEVALLLQAYGLFFFLANRIRTTDDLIFCLLVLVMALATQSLLVFGLAALGPRAHGQRFDFGPLAVSVWDDGRVAGSLQSAVVCGSLMALLWMPVMACTLIVRQRLLWILVSLVTGAGMLAVLLTQTRGAILTMMIGTTIVAVAMYLRGTLPRWTFKAAIVLGIIGIIPLMTIIQQRVIGGDDGSASSRKHLTLIALESIQQAALFGHGAGNCHIAAEDVANQGKFRSEWYYTIHSKYLLTWLEVGLFGLISFLFVLGNGIRYGVRSWLSRDPLLAPLGLAMAAGIGGHMIHMAVDIFNSRPQVQLLWVFIGVAAAIYRISCLNKSEASGGGSLRVA